MRVSVAEDVLAAQPNGVSEFPGVFSGWLGTVAFLIAPAEANDDRFLDVAMAAEAAVARFALVTDDGIELPGTWAHGAERGPDSVLGPCRLGTGMVVGADAQDGIVPAQGATMLRIVLGELYARGISAHVSCPPPTVDLWALQRWPEADQTAPHPRSPGSDGSTKRWFIRRNVDSLTTTGVGYWDVAWLQLDGTWSLDQAAATSFEDTPLGRQQAGELVSRIHDKTEAQHDGRRLGGTMSILLAPGDRGSIDPPPDSIRDHGHTWREPTPEDYGR